MFIEITGPIPCGNGRYVWMVYVYNSGGKRVGEFEASSEIEAYSIKEGLAAALTNEARKEH